MTFQLKGRGISIRNPFGVAVAIPPQIDEKRLADLTTRLMAGVGTKEERDEIAHGFLRLAVSIAGIYASRSPSLTDDYVQSALFGLVKGLETAKEKLRDENITPYLTTQMHSMCRRFQAKERLFGYTQSQRWRRAQAGKDGTLPTLVPLEVVKHMKSGGGSARDVKEILELAVHDEIDEQIVDLRQKGFNDREIGEAMGYSNSFIATRRRILATRFDNLNM